MGKDGGGQQEQPQVAEAAEVAGGGERRRTRCRACRGSVRLQCVAAVMLSSLFWLPPFAGRGRRAGAPEPPGDAFAADIVASFMLQKTVSELSETTSKLELDIYEEIGIPNSTVTVNFLRPLGASNWTNIIFSVNLYIKLTNLHGSTVDPPTIVRASIILEVGNHQPSLPRMKQLAQTITNSSSGNLGLNHTVFGRVKQISLSSYLCHSLHSGAGTDAPSPAPVAHQGHHDNHHHHHHHHSHHHSHEVKKHLAPSPAPVHSHVEQPKYRSPTRSGCSYGCTNKPKSKAPVAPAAEPVANNYYDSPHTMPHAGSPSSISPSTSVTINPSRHHISPTPSPVSAKPPLRTVSLSHVHHPAQVRAVPPAPDSSFATRRHSCQWALAFLLCLLMGLP